MALITEPVRQEQAAPPPPALRQAAGQPRLLLLLVAYALAIGAYAVVRYNATAVDTDSAVLTEIVRAVLAEGTVISREHAYANGFAFPGLAAYMVFFTGLDIDVLQRFSFPLLIAGLVPAAFAFFREVTRDSRAGLIATVFLYLQPDFLFVTLRGSHERFTIALMMVALFLLVRAYRVIENFWPFALHILLFYLAVFAVIGSNTLYGSSFLAALLLSLFIGLALVRVRVRELFSTEYVLPRLVFPASVSLALMFLELFYLYPPSNQLLTILRTAGDRLVALLLGVNVHSNPYVYIADTWVGTWMYVVLTTFNWTVLASSLVIWLWWGYQWLVLRHPVVVRSHLLLWCFYFAFAAQVAISAVLDFTGLLGANLQLRVFPAFMLMAIPMTALVLRSALAALHRQRTFSLALMTVGCVMAFAAVLKATNEPLLSNKWGFPTAAEITALQWLDSRVRSATVWTDSDERLTMTAAQLKLGRDTGMRYAAFRPSPDASYFLLSDAVRTRAERRRFVLPDVSTAERIYDNGAAEVYHRYPRTPFQQ